MFNKIDQHLDAANTKLEGTIQFGIVVNNNDPMKIGRLQIRVSTLHAGYSDSQLPWALSIADSCMGAAPGIGSLNIPVTGSKVAVFFPSNDATDTFYIGSTLDATNSLALGAYGANYPNVIVNLDRAGNLLKIDTVAKTWTLNLVDGSYITFNQGMVTMVTTQGFQLKVNGDLDIAATGNVNISGSEVNLNPSSNPASNLNSNPLTTPQVTTFTNMTNY